MNVSYKPLWDLLKQRNMKKKDLMKIADLAENCIANMGNNKNISLNNLGKICIALDCTLDDVVKIIKEEV